MLRATGSLSGSNTLSPVEDVAPILSADTLFFVLIATVLCFARFRLGLRPLQTYDDDFFYYLRAATNFVHTGRSTFDGVHLTNGYHPLWFLLVSAIVRTVPAGAFFVALQIVEWTLALTTFACLRMLFRQLAPHRAMAVGAAVVVATFAATLARGGMEIGLLFPCIAGALAYRLRPAFCWTGKQAFWYGLMLGLAILARLDAMLLVLLLAAAEVVRSPRPRLVAAALPFALGLLPVVLYLLSNWHWFHLWLPVSGQVKQLQLHHGISLLGISRVVLSFASPVLTTIIWSALLFTVVAFVRYRRCGVVAVWRRLALALLLFPALHLLLVAVRSDWAVWPWYFYPFVLSGIGAAVLLLPQATSAIDGVFARVRWALYALMLLGAVGAVHVSATAQQMYRENQELAAWMDLHPGIYAMGDVGGMLSIMTTRPMVQMEGLMQDRTFLKALQAQVPLPRVLQQSGATYYIAGLPPPDGKCYAIREPAQAGSNSPHMQGVLCPADGLLHSRTDRHHQIYPAGRVHAPSWHP